MEEQYDQMWRCGPEVSAIERMRQECCTFQDSHGLGLVMLFNFGCSNKHHRTLLSHLCHQAAFLALMASCKVEPIPRTAEGLFPLGLCSGSELGPPGYSILGCLSW